MAAREWTERDANEFIKLISNGVKEYKTLAALTEAHNALADVKRSQGAICFRLQACLSAGLLKGEKEDHADILIYNYKSSLPKKVKPPVPVPVVKENFWVPDVPASTPIYVKPDWLPAREAAAQFGYTTSWIEMVSRYGHVRRVQKPFRTIRGKNVQAWYYSLEDIAKYLASVRTRMTNRIVARKIAQQETPDIPNNKERLLKLFKEGKVDASTALDMLEKL